MIHDFASSLNRPLDGSSFGFHPGIIEFASDKLIQKCRIKLETNFIYNNSIRSLTLQYVMFVSFCRICYNYNFNILLQLQFILLMFRVKWKDVLLDYEAYDLNL